MWAIEFVTQISLGMHHLVNLTKPRGSFLPAAWKLFNSPKTVTLRKPNFATYTMFIFERFLKNFLFLRCTILELFAM